jgi:hypothetical protein
MVYYLGRDVKVMICSENSTKGIGLDGSNNLQLDPTPSTALFAQELTSTGAGTAFALTDLTGVDLGIGVTDEDITYIGQKSVLKAEIKKETTISLTKKKSDMLWDIVFNGAVKSGDEFVSGTVNHGARWGVAEDSETYDRISNGLFAPKDHVEGSDVTFGYRVFIQLKSGSEVFTVPGCTVTGHTVTMNADGTSEETMEFMSNVDPKIGATANVTRLAVSDM